MSLKTEPRGIVPTKKGDCPECGGVGVVGMYQDRCNSCDGSGLNKEQENKTMPALQYTNERKE